VSGKGQIISGFISASQLQESGFIGRRSSAGPKMTFSCFSLPVCGVHPGGTPRLQSWAFFHCKPGSSSNI